MANRFNVELYTCNGCKDAIASNRARILCDVCDNFNLCSNCFVIDSFSTPHSKSHQTTIMKKSGCIDSESSNFLNLQHATNVEEAPKRYSEIPTANWGALWNVMKAPLVKLDKKSSKSVDKIDTTNSQGNSPSSRLSEPLSTPLSSISKVTTEILKPAYIRPEKWEPFFESDGNPTSVFVALIGTIFNILDSDGTGYLRPEVYSDFLEIQGYPLSANIWKMAWKKAAGASSKDVADLELGFYFSQRAISHVLVARPTETQTGKRPSLDKIPSPKTKREGSTVVDENMPLLSCYGFNDICAYEYHKDPSMAHQYLMNALQKLGIWKELGDLPRSVLPDSPKFTSVESPQINTIPDIILENGDKKSKPDSPEVEKLESLTSSPKINHNFHDCASLSPSIRIRRSSVKSTQNPGLHNQKKLVLQTNFPCTYLASPSPISARSPNRRKVESLIEAYEHARGGSFCLDERKIIRARKFSIRHSS